MQKDVQNIEEKYLNYSKEEILKLIETEEKRFKELPMKYKDDPFLLQELMSILAIKLKNLETSKQKPYFARIDFKNNKEENTEVCYIGKIGVISNDSKIVVVDWRAPISTLYYDSNIGNAEYIAPEGRIKGELKLKRQIVIEDGNLKDIFDVDSVSDDELLKPYLGVNADSRLKNIVASIQSEQNSIIRENLQKDLIVQGVAGSGKTTVALHRISYLIYNSKDVNKNEKFMVIGPNKFFINYISSVLPDLDVVGVKQLTINELGLEYIGENIKIIDNCLKNVLNNQQIENNNIYKVKTSMKYKKILDRYIKDIENSFFNNEGLKLYDDLILTSNQIKNIYKDNMKDVCITKKIERTNIIISNKILERQEQLKEKIRKVFAKRIRDAKNEQEIAKLKEIQFSMYKSINNGLKDELKAYFKAVNKKILNVYKEFIQNIDKYTDSLELNTSIQEYIEYTLKNINKKQIEVEDLPAMMYLKYKLFGNDEYKKYLHVVIDEAQDFGEFHFYILKKIMNKSTFSIFGDIAQSIYSFRAIDNWDSVIHNVFKDKCQLMELKKSYRTSIEIMEEANKVTNYIGLGNAKPVIRHGKPVNILKIENYEDKIENTINKIKEHIKNNYKSIAVICKNEKTANKVYKDLKERIQDIELMTENNETYNGGICVMTAYLSKGLEFDANIIIDVDEETYNSDNLNDMKLLYVAMTRALHETDIIYTKTLVKPLINN
ncbi:MAG: DNA helicase [Clostridiales bacterium]|nr:DNA helicase [Clostridiales bacterium]